MCAPAAAVAGVQLAAGAASAIGSHQSASAQANAANQAAINNYKYQLKVRSDNWDQARHIYGQKLFQHDQQISENRFAAARGYAAAQRNLNEKFRQAAFKNESRLAQLIKGQGNFAAAGRSGRSADRLDMEQLAQFGRGRARISEGLMTARNVFDEQGRTLNREQLRADQKSFQTVAINPKPTVAPVRPVMQSGPSGLSLAGDLLGAAGGAFGTYDTLTPGGAFGQRVD